MQARRKSSSSSLPLPSSPPSVLHAEADPNYSPDARGAPSPAQTLWTCPSPTQTLGYSSPELPPLASLSAVGNLPRTPSTVARHERTDSTSYFTASWGSPYRHPPPSFNRGRIVSTNLGSDDLDDSTHLEFGLEHLLPRPLEEDNSPNRFNLEHLLPDHLEQDEPSSQFNLEHLIPSRLPSILDTPTRSGSNSNPATQSLDQSPSEAWVRQFLDRRWNRETSNWVSDSETDRSVSEEKPVIEQSKKKGHPSRKNNKTLNQQDFWSHFSEGQKEELGKMMASRYANPDTHSRQGSGGSLRSQMGRSSNVERTAAAPSVSSPVEAPKPSEAPAKPAAPAAEQVYAPRPRKKVLVKGKGCIISIARDVPRGTPGYPPKPMTEAAVREKMQQFERAGYDTRGFGHRQGDDTIEATALSQNRGIWPSDEYIRTERLQGHRVRVPNKADWDAYVNHLTEAKLAALGVSLGGDDEDLSASRTASAAQIALPFSPPLPTSSAGSHRIQRQGSIVSGSFPLGPSPGHVSRQSMASPMSAFGPGRPSMHMHRHSTFSPASFMQQATSPLNGSWSPNNYFGVQGARGGSPALPLSRPDLADIVSPSSPFGMRPNQQFPLTPSQKDDLLAHMQAQQQQLQAQLMNHQQQQVLGMRPSSTLAEVPEDEAEEEEAPRQMTPPLKHATQPGPEITIPTPRGHRHNISANLEREARDAEYHLEEVIDKQFNEGGDFSTEPENAQDFKPFNPVNKPHWDTVLHQPQPHNRAHSLAKPSQSSPFNFAPQENPRGDSDGAKTNISDVTNPSLEDGELHEASNASTQHSKAPSQVSNSWKDPKFAFGKPGSAMHSKHTSQSSVSKFNVEAKEFKFNPSASFNPTASFSPSVSSNFSFSPALNSTGFDASQSNRTSLDGMSGFNVTAPSFKPDAPAFKPDAPAFKPDVPAFKPDPTLSGNAMPSSGFNFASKGPSFKPDAPVFNPGSSSFQPALPNSPPTVISSKIFGNVSISANDIIKPAKRSKAVPIIRPDTTRQKTPEVEEEVHEDEAGRITNADGREKRARRGRADGDEVPKFALQPVLPSQPMSEARSPQTNKQEIQADREVLPEDKENLSPNAEDAPAKSKTPESLPLAEAEAVEDLVSSPESDAVTPTVEEAPKPFGKTHKHKSSLSAAAKPFEFRPQNSYDLGIHVTKPSVSQNEELDVHSSPARNASRSPATTFRPSDDGSFKTALESRRHVQYPESESVDFDQLGQASFNDIDAVMKHMNEEGSDFGVERDEPAWEPSSPRLSTHDFERNDLPPTTNLRSDAPSPSPRRLYVPPNMHASSTSIITQDPFDDERAGLAYESPVHRLNNADEVPMSDWDEGLLSEGEDKIQTRSRFFDSHVDDIIGRLLQNRLGPLEQNLQVIQDSISMISQSSVRGRRSMSTNERLDSDADDEDDEFGTDSHFRNRSPRKDRKMEKIRSIIKEALEANQPSITSLPVPVPEPILPERIRDIVADALVAHQEQSRSSEQAQSENIRDIITEALAHHQPPAPAVAPVTNDDIRSIVAEALAAQEPKQTADILQPEDIRATIMEAFATHVPPQAPAPVPEQIWPDDIRAIVTEAIAAQQAQAPAPIPEIVQPDEIRAIVAEALASQKPAQALEAPVDIPQPQVDLSEIYQVIGSLKASIAQTTSHNLQADEVRELIDDAFKRQDMQVATREESQAIQEKDARIAELERMLEETSGRLAEEVEVRQALEGREADSARLLKVTEEELLLLREAASDDEHKIRALRDEAEDARRSLDTLNTGDEELRNKLIALEVENDELKLKAVAFESSEEDIKQRLNAVTAENEALSFTLEEHRLSADKWRNDLKQAHEETENMRKAVDTSRLQAEEAARIREAMRSKFEKLQQDMIVASGQAGAERVQWQKSDEEHMKRYEILSARIEAEGRTRERLERELERLETQEREGMKLRITLEQSQKHNARLEETLEQLKHESMEHQRAAERYEREFREAREAAHVEIRRTRVLMEADLDAANNQVNIVRAELESEISRVRSELDNVRMDADHLKAKHELDLEAASDAKKHAVDEALEKQELVFREQQQAFERRMDRLTQEHSRALEIAHEDMQRAEAYGQDRLSLADSKMEHLKDKVSLLEERLSIAKEAASAAAAAAQSVKSPTFAGPTSSFSSGGPEKISAQALRESIAVLQEQLQERESRIESLEHQIEEVDTDAPNKLKERDTEIGWLRELLGVRIDDLNDLIDSLAQPTFDRETVRDAAIRIRTNLQMEQHEKERLITGGQSFPTLSTLSNFASPKAVQLAAAFGNWRKGRENASSALAGSGNNSRNQTPSRTAPGPAQSFLSGLMTPPTSNLRRTPDLPSSTARPQSLRTNSNSSRGSNAGFAVLGKQPIPSTPPLLRKASYDQDAEDGHFSESGFYDDESTVDGDITPIGLNFGTELRR
ncbi:hypothetical protein BU24DRAFT_342278 [Aaosphaeria arxii CBS 175.79]|uniref:Myosin class II heavy chain n=1 Tax=Aaosphaeria arxii CBS 175.79 TaxID=1450172 RepID=A0A6A5Y226_9PLEO|nr:uncharacterized protein BU24DRAFT_342278 [Aaosphaeria arxii CBS 175.79]KAF2018880.1 hypothetical protein BU24DRAFT_342278 [Aaosphaeria arxii CBS 175.79]